MAYDFTPTGDLAADLEKIYTDASGSAKPMSEAELAGAEAAAIMVSASSGIPPYESSASFIQADGVASVGTRSTIPRSDHIHPSDPTKVSITGAQSVAGVKTFLSFPLTPYEAPVDDYQVANKKYVDDSVASPNIPFETNPEEIQMDGEQSAGTLLTVPKADHVHPSDSSKVSKTGDETIAGIKTFVDNLKTTKIIPVADGISAIIITKADGTTPVFTIDTTNNKIFDSNGVELINKNQAVATALIFG